MTNFDDGACTAFTTRFLVDCLTDVIEQIKAREAHLSDVLDECTQDQAIALVNRMLVQSATKLARSGNY